MDEKVSPTRRNRSFMAVELPRKVADIARPGWDTLHTDDLMLLGILQDTSANDERSCKRCAPFHKLGGVLLLDEAHLRLYILRGDFAAEDGCGRHVLALFGVTVWNTMSKKKMPPQKTQTRPPLNIWDQRFVV